MYKLYMCQAVGLSPASASCLALSGTRDARACLRSVLRTSTFLPPFPQPGFALRTSRGTRRCGTMRALTPAGLARTRQVSPLTPPCLPNIPSPTTSSARTSLSQSPQRVQSELKPAPGFATNEQARRKHTAESGSSSYGLLVRLRLLPTPPRDDAVTFGYGAVVFSDTDLHRADKTPSWAHD